MCVERGQAEQEKCVISEVYHHKNNSQLCTLHIIGHYEYLNCPEIPQETGAGFRPA